jgi:polysaccharide export outer membrane protein
MKQRFGRPVLFLIVFAALAGATEAQSPATAKQTPAPTSTARVTAPVVLPPGYVIGAEDVLTVNFWRDKELSADAVVVRPDGMISLPLLNDIRAAGYTPEQLSGALEKAALKFIADPDATVTVKEIRSRKVAVLGEVNKQGTVLLTREMTVVDVLAEAGGPLEYADKKNITIVRMENSKERRIKFNYADYLEGKNIQQNIPMLPGDKVLVP